MKSCHPLGWGKSPTVRASTRVLVGRYLELMQNAVRENLPADLAVQPVLDRMGVRAGPPPHPGAAARALVDLVLPNSQSRVRGLLRLLEGHAAGVDQLT